MHLQRHEMSSLAAKQHVHVLRTALPDDPTHRDLKFIHHAVETRRIQSTSAPALVQARGRYRQLTCSATTSISAGKATSSSRR
ncbi:hypothetical protein PG996_008164 [Apiospora saccharicola]|uniref:Uncharacterized protein n=1 Tax=Apiospora saccharicola TaxID=335842 RepID=A0ABR1UX54_9PEZI